MSITSRNGHFEGYNGIVQAGNVRLGGPAKMLREILGIEKQKDKQL